jgi:tetratricopeptide (TPR) repeat protein
MQIKCTSCGATQELAANHQCGYCGSAIEQEKAQENYKSSTTGEFGNLMIMAETAVDATNWEEALQYFNKALEKDITNSDAWLGKGIAMVYTSKIGDIKTKEAIAYWKNAIKHAQNPDAMGKRVAKEINTVVNTFYPAIEKHYIEFNNLDNAFQELVGRFSTLEIAQDYATQLDSDNIEYLETGYYLCKRVVSTPKKFAVSAGNSAIAEGIMGQFTSNQYSRKFAANDAGNKLKKANSRKNEIIRASKVIFEIEEKYIQKLQQKVTNKEYMSSRNEFINSSDGKKEEIQNAFKENPIKGWKVWWENQSTVAKVSWVTFFIILFLAAIFQEK